METTQINPQSTRCVAAEAKGISCTTVMGGNREIEYEKLKNQTIYLWR